MAGHNGFAFMVEAVQEFARINCNVGGWDMIDNCWSAEEIQAVLVEEGCASKKDAIRVIGKIASTWHDRRRDVEAEAASGIG